MSRAAAAGRTPEAAVSPAAACLLHEVFAEAYRLRLLRSLEDQLALCGYRRIGGADEAGRGSLAGPVVAAAVVVDRSRLVPGVDDSKCLAAPERERLAEAIRAASHAVAVASVPAKVIDQVNIYQASRMAMCQALTALRPSPDCAVVDAVPLAGCGFPCLPVVRGDAISYAVACASIIAKVERDRLMVDLHRRHPQYGFASHKGYSVPEHLAALAAYGPCPEHRLTYRPVVPRGDGGARGRRVDCH